MRVRVFWLAAWGCAALWAGSTTVIHTSTHLVQLSVTVTGAHGRHVAGLQLDDFEVLDGGSKPPIAFFSELASAADTPRSPLPDGVFANRPASHGDAAPPVMVILFDSLNTRFSEQSRARDALAAFLRNNAGGGLTALYGLKTELSLLVDFTPDPAALLRGVEGYSPAENVNRAAAAPRPAEMILLVPRGFCPANLPADRAAEIEARYYMPERRVRPTMAALTAIADRIAGMPGRKNLIWISGSFPISMGIARNRVLVSPSRDAAVFGDDLDTLARRLNSANIVVYPVNTAGVAPLDMGIEDHVSPMGSVTNAAANPILSATLIPDSSNATTLAQIAAWTGGMVSSSNEIGDQLRKAFDDGRQGYLIGFYAPNWDGKFHELQMKVHQSGARARTRQGYYAVDDPSSDPATRLSAALRDTADAMEIPMEVAAAKQGPASKATVTARAHVPGGALEFASTADGWAARVKLVYLQMDAEGKKIWQLDRDLAIQLSDANHAKAATSGLRFTTPIEMRDGAKELRVVLQDRESGAVGSVTMNVDRIPLHP